MNYKEGPHPEPEESYSRQLDRMVCEQEKPYGYTSSPPPADSGDFNTYQYDQKYGAKRG